MKEEFVIIGGGIAGLAAAIKLAELGKRPFIIEGGSYPSHKVCGEFLSPECISILNDWNIEPIPITKARIRTPSQELLFPFTTSAGGLSHLKLDPDLAAHARSHNVQILTETRVLSFKPKNTIKGLHTIELSNSDKILAKHVIFATGRIPSLNISPPKMLYMGIKSHFKGLPAIKNLEMFSFPGAYLGISPVENEVFNIACLVSIKEFEKFKDIEQFIHSLGEQNVHLKNILSHGTQLFSWMHQLIPAFGFKKTPDWPDTYFIGDAALSIPPATGNGLALALLGGYISAEYSILSQYKTFKKEWTHRCTWQMRWAKFLHHLMMNPLLANPTISLIKKIPSLGSFLFTHTRQIKK